MAVVLTPDQQRDKRREMAKKLVEMNARKRDEKVIFGGISFFFIFFIILLNVCTCMIKYILIIFVQLAEDEEQLSQLQMIQEMIDDGEPIEEVKVNIYILYNHNCVYNDLVMFLGSITITWVEK